MPFFPRLPLLFLRYISCHGYSANTHRLFHNFSPFRSHSILWIFFQESAQILQRGSKRTPYLRSKRQKSGNTSNSTRKRQLSYLTLFHFCLLYKIIQVKSDFKLSMSMVLLLTDSWWCMRDTPDLL